MLDEKGFQLYWKGLSKNDTTVLKAAGIAMIVLHNYFHKFSGWSIQNEFTFKAKNFKYLSTHLSLNLFNDIGLLFSYFGHYGVQLFVFLSAYGLYTSYKNKPLYYWQFVRERIWKLWPASFLAVLFLIIYTIITKGSFYHPRLYLGSLLRLSFLSNLVPRQSLRNVGPWWFYSMIVQFYLIFPLLRKWFDRYGLLPHILLSAISWVLVYLFIYQLNAKGVNLIALVIGHLPVFCLGMVLAKYKNHLMPLGIFIAACVLFYFGNIYMSAWLFTQICVTLIFLYIYVFLKKIVKPGTGLLKKVLFFVGNLSMYLFAVNGFLRPPFVRLAEQHPGIFMKCTVLVVFLLWVTLVALLLRLAEKYFLKFFLKPLFPKLPVKAM